MSSICWTDRSSHERLSPVAAECQRTLEAGWQGVPHFGILCGDEALPVELAAQLDRRRGRLWNLYGPTETTVWSAITRIVPGAPITLGRPIANTRIYLLDRGDPVPPGAVGELHIAGMGLARGYLGRPDLTAERFVPDPFGRTPGGRLYRTGDQARFRFDGRIEYLGRRDYPASHPSKQASTSWTIHQYIAGVNNAGWTRFPGLLWQRNYWDRVIRNERELNNIRWYIRDNSRAWAEDEYHPRKRGRWW